LQPGFTTRQTPADFFNPFTECRLPSLCSVCQGQCQAPWLPRSAQDR
jgi:hypothetical protein